jgi:Mg2+/Co2+ transporter CorB
MDPTIIYILLVILLILSAFFSASETAYTSFSKIRMKNLAKTKKSARLALKLSTSYDKLITTILIGNNITNIAGTTLATILCVRYSFSTGLCTLIVTVVVLIFGEIIPKSFSKIVAEKFAMFASYPLVVLYYLVYPIALLFEGINILIKKNLKFLSIIFMKKEH